MDCRNMFDPANTELFWTCVIPMLNILRRIKIFIFVQVVEHLTFLTFPWEEITLCFVSILMGLNIVTFRWKLVSSWSNHEVDYI